MPKKNEKVKIHDKVVQVKPLDLKKNPYNPNKMDAFTMKSLVHGIQTEGFYEPILVQKSTNMIINGEHRWKAARKLKMTKVPVIFLDVSDVEARKLTTALMFRHGVPNAADLQTLVNEIRDMEKRSLAKLELDLSIAKKQLKEMFTSVEADAAVAKGMTKKTKAKKERKKKSPKKLKVAPSVPTEDFDEGDAVEEAFEGTHKYPMTFFALTADDRALIQAMFYDTEEEEYSFDYILKLVKYYLKKHPKKRAKVLAAMGSED